MEFETFVKRMERKLNKIKYNSLYFYALKSGGGCGCGCGGTK